MRKLKEKMGNSTLTNANNAIVNCPMCAGDGKRCQYCVLGNVTETMHKVLMELHHGESKEETRD